MRLLHLLLFLVSLLPSTYAQFDSFNGGGSPFGVPQQPLPVAPNNFDYSPTLNRFSLAGTPLFVHGLSEGDATITDNQRSNGLTIRLHSYFPFYGGRYNYTMISTNGFISFAYFTEDAHTFQVGLDTNWPKQADPALIAPYLCKQRIQSGQGVNSEVFYRIERREGRVRQVNGATTMRPNCAGYPSHVFCDQRSDEFLDAMQRSLQDGVAGAGAFRADSALIVTWFNLRPNIGSELGLSTYQLVWLTDAQGLLSYTIINYDKLGYEAADMNGNTRTGRCQAVFNGGNHTGTVQVDLSEMTKERPSSLADRSAIPHVARGRYVHRVDDVVRPAGCSNKTGGSFPLLIYPNIVNMLGQMKVDVNGLCLNPSTTYVLMIEQRDIAPCEVINPSIARCALPKILDWGTKKVYFQPQSGSSSDEKAYVGFLYFVPPTIDPMRLDIGDIHAWYSNPLSMSEAIIKVRLPLTLESLQWYARNFTSQRFVGPQNQALMNYRDDSIYQMSLGLYVVGYAETENKELKKFVPTHRVLAKLVTVQNQVDEMTRWNPQIAHVPLSKVDEWYLTDWEKHHDLFDYRFGYLKLAPIRMSGDSFVQGKKVEAPELPEGLISSPISLHWLWTIPSHAEGGAFHGSQEDKSAKKEFVKHKSKEMCQDWFDEDGALPNFVRETETNSSCPCRMEQAVLDLGRFMPHPRCSSVCFLTPQDEMVQLFRDITCTETLGSMNCFMSAQNVQGSHVKKTSSGTSINSYATHYGQTCCYDSQGYLMQSSYQPVVTIDASTPYNPGFPTRAYEFGSEPYQGMYEVPGLSSFHHDIMPYYLCCKFADFRCQMFYWRRPSSACQAYTPPTTGSLMGAGVFNTLDNKNFVFNEPGVFTLLHSHRTASSPEVQIQVRMERFPDRSVDFGAYNRDQADLVQPSNTTVLTGVVISSSDADKVHVILRKDTRRFRYRTSIIVDNVIRYFDSMIIQRFRGVTVYVNNVQRGQAEIYVVLDHAQIGVRIRESFALDIDRQPAYMESFGLLDLLVSVPPQYKLNQQEEIYNAERPHMEGLLLPIPDQFVNLDGARPLAWEDVNNEGMRATLMKYRVKSEYDTSYPASPFGDANDVVDLFTAVSSSETLFEAFPDHFLKGPVYKTAAKYLDNAYYPFRAQTRDLLYQFIDFCKRGYDVEWESAQERQWHKRCPSDMAALEQNCGNDVACLFDAILLQARVLGDESRNHLHEFMLNKYEGSRKYNSCGAINLEYPEYLVKEPSRTSPAYLEGDKVSFSCFQNHIVKGHNDFVCRRIESRHDPHDFRMQWTQGEQPWCRHRVKDNVLTWLFWTGMAILIILAVIIPFALCWHRKQAHKQMRAEKQRNAQEMEALNDMSHYETKKPSPPSSLPSRTRDSPSPYVAESLQRSPSGSSLHQNRRGGPQEGFYTPPVRRGGAPPPVSQRHPQWEKPGIAV